jgi:hypothetical protein
LPVLESMISGRIAGPWHTVPTMRSAEITPYKPTYRGLMLPASVL